MSTIRQQPPSCHIELPLHVRQTAKVQKHLAFLKQKCNATFESIDVPSGPAYGQSDSDGQMIDASSTLSIDPMWGSLSAPTSADLNSAIQYFSRVTGGNFKYANTRVVFRHRGHRVAMAFLGQPDASWMGAVVPFGAPVLSGTDHFSKRLFGGEQIRGISVSGTCFDTSCDGKIGGRQGGGGIYFFFTIVLDVHLVSDPPRPPLEEALRPTIRPMESAALLRNPRGASATDLVVFVVITRQSRGAHSQPAPDSCRSNNSNSDCDNNMMMASPQQLLTPQPNGNGQDIEVLLICEKRYEWFTPAGHIERGQTFADAAAMELIEESGFTLDTSRPLVPYDIVYGSASYDSYNSDAIAPIHILYTGKVDESRPQVEAVDGRGVAWVPLTWLLLALSKREAMPECMGDGVLPRIAPPPAPAGPNDNAAAASASSTTANANDTLPPPLPFRKPWELHEVFSKFAQKYAPLAYRGQ